MDKFDILFHQSNCLEDNSEVLCSTVPAIGQSYVVRNLQHSSKTFSFENFIQWQLYSV